MLDKLYHRAARTEEKRRKLQWIQIIWINALKEGIMELESRFDKLDQER